MSPSTFSKQAWFRLRRLFHALVAVVVALLLAQAAGMAAARRVVPAPRQPGTVDLRGA